MDSNALSLRASDVSALCDRHIYRTSETAIWDLVCATRPCEDDHTAYIRRLTAQIEECVRQGPCYLHAVRLRELDDGSCRDAEREAMEAFNQFRINLGVADRRRLRRNIRSVYLKDRGIFMEIHTLRRLGEINVRWRPTEKRQRFFTKTFGPPDLRYTINGCVDGLEFGEAGEISGLIEVKTRRDKAHLPTHDLDQIMMYLVLSDLPQGRLVQDVNGQLKADYIMTLEHAQQRWDRVRPILELALRRVAAQLGPTPSNLSPPQV